MRVSLLPDTNDVLQLSSEYEKMIERCVDELRNVRSRREFLGAVEKQEIRQRDYADTVTDLVKELLSSKDPATKDNVMRWLATAVSTSMGRSRDSRGIIDPSGVASDAFCLTVTEVLLNLCDPFTDPAKEELASESRVTVP